MNSFRVKLETILVYACTEVNSVYSILAYRTRTDLTGRVFGMTLFLGLALVFGLVFGGFMLSGGKM
ncbi:MAG: hypothetical protein VXW58_17415, partial [Pseudomonadota bacterium]|nr:hypothetical protein [Pseudomonadota bacterium]